MLATILTVIGTLALSAFFSGMEIAFVSSNKLKLEIEKKQSRVLNYIADIFLKDPGQYITSILVGNNIALVLYSLYMSILLNALFSRWGWHMGDSSILVETVVSTVVIIFTAEFLPKAVVRINPNLYLRKLAVPVYFFYVILYPIARFSTWLSVLLLRLFGHKIDTERQTIKAFDRVDLENLLESSGEGEQEMESEMKLVQNALDFPDLRVRDCMVPRVDIEAVERHATIEELAAQFIESKFSRIFVYDETVDNIIGYVNSKSLFNKPRTIAEVLKKVDYVPETMATQKLLTTFIKKKSYIAVVIDEFGGTAGVVSLEDILEEIFGEIEDEHDSQDLVEKAVGEGEYVFSCRLEVDYLNEKYGLGIEESDEYDTLAGYIIYHFEGIPPAGQVLTVDGKQIKVVKTTSSRVELARIKIM